MFFFFKLIFTSMLKHRALFQNAHTDNATINVAVRLLDGSPSCCCWNNFIVHHFPNPNPTETAFLLKLHNSVKKKKKKGRKEKKKGSSQTNVCTCFFHLIGQWSIQFNLYNVFNNSSCHKAASEILI